MGLNDDMLDDITGAGDVVLPGEEGKKDHVDIIVPADPTETPDTVSEDMLNKVINAEVSIKTIDDNIAKVVELKDIDETIAGANSISRDDAENINTAFEGFINDNLLLAEFTVSPSKTNLKQSRDFMQKRIAKEEQSLVASYQLFLEQPLEDVKTAFSNVSDNYLPGLTSNLYKLQTEANNLVETLAVNKDTIFFISGVPTNILTYDIFNSEVKTELDYEGFDMGLFKNSINNIGIALNNHMLRQILWSILNTVPVERAFDKENQVESNLHIFTLQDLVDVFNSSCIMNYVEQLKISANEAIIKLDKIKQDSDGIKDEFDAIEKYLVNAGSDISTSFTSVKRFISLAFSLQNLCLNTKVIYDFLRKL